MGPRKKQSGHLNNTHGWPHLPEELLLSIFSYIPFGLLRQCRFVCRDWYLSLKNMIGDQVLCRMHYSQTHHQDDTPDFLLLSSGSKSYTVDYQALENLDAILEAQALKFNLPTDHKIQLHGSCNGFLCFSSPRMYESFYIVNPVTGETIELPNPNNTKPDPNRNACWIFNFDKVIFVEQFYNGTYVKIYTFGSDTWRVKWTVNRISSISLVLLNGALHFLTVDDLNVTAFNIASDNFTEFAVPPDRLDSSSAKSLCSLEECLCLVDDEHEYIGTEEIALWILKDYGLKDSWCKLYVIRREVLKPFLTNPLKFMKRLSNGCIFLHGSDGQGYYDPQNEAFKPIFICGIHNQGGDDVHAVSLHKGSLLSPQSVLP